MIYRTIGLHLLMSFLVSKGAMDSAAPLDVGGSRIRPIKSVDPKARNYDITVPGTKVQKTLDHIFPRLPQTSPDAIFEKAG